MKKILTTIFSILLLTSCNETEEQMKSKYLVYTHDQSGTILYVYYTDSISINPQGCISFSGISEDGRKIQFDEFCGRYELERR